MLISYAQYQDMTMRILQFKMQKGRKPKYVTVKGQKITQTQYDDMMRRVDAFVRAKKRNPKSVQVLPGTQIQTVSTVQKSKNWLNLEEALKTQFTSALGLYSILKSKGNYKYYYNDKFTNSMALTRLRKGLGVNCTDYAQLLYPILKDMKYQVRYVHGRVKCADKQWYGHVWLQIKGREYENWVNYDVVAVTHNGIKRPLGSLVCVGGLKDMEYNPDWLI